MTIYQEVRSAEVLFRAVRGACCRLIYALAFEDGEEAGGTVACFLLLLEGWFVFFAVVLGPRAAGVEVAPARGIGGRWYVAGEDHALALAFLVGIGDGDGREQGGGVGVTRLAL